MPTRTNRLQATSATSFGTGAYTPASFTPSNNSLLYVVAFFIANTDDASEGTSLTITDSAGLTWTSRAASTTSPGWSYGVRVWTAPVTTGVSMTVSIDCGTTDVYCYRVEVYDFTNYDTVTPVQGAVVGSDADGDGAHSLTLGATPATDSILMAHVATGYGSGTGSVTPNANWTELFDTDIVSWLVCQSQNRTGTTSTSVDWDDVLATGASPFGSSSVALEIRNAPSGTIDQQAFRFGADDGSESAHTWLAAQDTNANQQLNTNTLIRFLLQATGAPTAKAFKLQWRRSTEGTNDWKDVT